MTGKNFWLVNSNINIIFIVPDNKLMTLNYILVKVTAFLENTPK